MGKYKLQIAYEARTLRILHSKNTAYWFKFLQAVEDLTVDISYGTRCSSKYVSTLLQNHSILISLLL